MPLQPATAVDQRAVLFGKTGGRQADDFGLNAGCFDIVVRPDIAPEFRGFGGQRVHHHQPLEFGQRDHHTVLVGQGGDGIEALADVAVDLPFAHHVEHFQYVVAGNVELGQPVVAPVVVGGGVGSVPGFHQADVELAVVLPVGQLPGPQRLERTLGNVGVVVLFGIARQCQVTGQQVRQQPEVGQALDVGVPAQGVDAPARHADVAQQQLHHGRAADHLRAGRMLGPAQSVEDRHGLARLRAGGDLFPDFFHRILRHAADLTGQFQGVAAVVLLHQLVDAARVQQGRIDFGKTVLADFIAPARLVAVSALGRIVAGKQPVLETKAFLDDERHVRIGVHVLVLDFVFSEQIVDQTAHEGDVGAGANRCVIVGHRGGTGEAWVDHDQSRLVVRFGFGHPFKATRVGFGGITAHDQDQIRVGDISPVIGHRATAIRWGKTCHRRAMSDTCLVIEPQHAQTANDLVGHVTGLVGGR